MGSEALEKADVWVKTRSTRIVHPENKKRFIILKVYRQMARLSNKGPQDQI